MDKPLTVALVGNPNCGKTTLFNLLTNGHQKVGNWAGVTVSKKTGRLAYSGREINIVDLPGVYSLSVADGGAIDERIACQYLQKGQADLIVNIVDAAHLQRHLFLTLQLLEMRIPCIVAVNMLDMAEKQQITVDCAALARTLGCPVVAMIGTQSVGIEELKATIVKLRKQTFPVNICLPTEIEAAIAALSTDISQCLPKINPQHRRWLAMRLLEKDALAAELVAATPLSARAAQHIQRLERDLQEDCDILLADCRYAKVVQVMEASVNTGKKVAHRLTTHIDAVVLHPWLGIPIFLLIMYLMFELSMSVGGLLQPLFDQTSSAILVDGVQYLGQVMGAPSWVTAILAQGAGMGINTILSFIPQIGLLFLILSFLEDSGYMARAAFVMDRLMQTVGLPGKSFIPLIVGFGCNVPAIMATRTLESHRDRVLTTLMAPFMSCGARLAIFAVFGSAFFPHHAGLLIFLLYLLGIVAAMLTGFLLKTTILSGQSSPFVLEMPNYHPPVWKNLWVLTWQRLKGFILRAGKVILPVCILVGSLNSIKIDSQSVLAGVSRVVTPIFAPMGLREENWPATVGLLTGILAKEVVVGTLNTLYAQDVSASGNPSFNLKSELKSAFTSTIVGLSGIFSAQALNPFTATMADTSLSAGALGRMIPAFGSAAAAFSYLLFVLLYVPCISTLSVIAREIGAKWAVFSLFWSISAAYSAAVLIYQLLVWRLHPQSSSAWIVVVILWQIVWWVSLKIKMKSKTENLCYP